MRRIGITFAKLTDWRNRALGGAATALKKRERDDRDDEIVRLNSTVGEITMDNELLNAKIAATFIAGFFAAAPVVLLRRRPVDDRECPLLVQ